ncbi:cytochrome C, partial [Pseudomonas sp. MWU13-2860]
DNIAYPVTGSPNTRGYIAELNYMIQPNWRVGLQYAGFLKYQGVSANYDGNGRNARNNNITYLYTWFAF